MEFLQEELDEILNIFQQESGEILQSMDKNLLILEKKPKNTEIAMQLFRDAHSLKGSARMLGFNGIQNIAHKIEDILGLVKDEKLVPDSYITDTISSALSFISGLIEKTFEQKNEYVTDEVDIYIDRLVKIAEGNSEDVVSVQSPEKEAVKFSEIKKNILRNINDIEDCLTGIIFIYSKCAQENDFSQISDLKPILKKLSNILFEIGLNDMDKISRKIMEIADEIISGKTKDEYSAKNPLIIDLNLQINEIVQYFNEICKNEDIKVKNYYENAYKLVQRSQGLLKTKNPRKLPLLIN